MARKRTVRRYDDYINVRLSKTADADLIEWWGKVRLGGGSDMIRQALREFIHKDEQPLSREELREDLNKTVGSIVDNVMRLQELRPAPVPNGTSQDQILQLIKVVGTLTQRINEMQAQIASGVIVGSAVQPPVEETAEGRLTAEEMEAKRRKVINRKW